MNVFFNGLFRVLLLSGSFCFERCSSAGLTTNLPSSGQFFRRSSLVGLGGAVEFVVYFVRRGRLAFEPIILPKIRHICLYE